MKISWSDLAKARMKALGISQESLSEVLGVTQGAVGHWLNGRRKAKLDEIFNIMNALDVTEFSIVDENGTLEVDPKQLAPREDSTVAERLKFVLSQMGWSQVDFAKNVGVSPQTVNNWIKRNALGAETAKTIAETTGFNAEWLLHGKGSPVKRDDQDSHHLLLIKTAHPVLAKEDFEAPNPPFCNEVKRIVRKDHHHDLLSLMGFNVDDLLKLTEKANTSHLLTVAGDSMSPVLSDGDIVIYDPKDTLIRDGKYYAIKIGNIERVKILVAKADGSILVRSINPCYEDELITENDLQNNKITILGRVWWSAGYK